MALYRKKPIVIEAVQWTLDNNGELENFVGGKEHVEYLQDTRSVSTNDVLTSTTVTPYVVVYAINGHHVLNVGDYVVKGDAGRLFTNYHAFTKECFEALYEPVVIDTSEFEFNEARFAQEVNNHAKM